VVVEVGVVRERLEVAGGVHGLSPWQCITKAERQRNGMKNAEVMVVRVGEDLKVDEVCCQCEGSKGCDVTGFRILSVVPDIGVPWC
jgi:hypothetical protein